MLEDKTCIKTKYYFYGRVVTSGEKKTFGVTCSHVIVFFLGLLSLKQNCNINFGIMSNLSELFYC